MPALGIGRPHGKEAEEQYVTDVSRGYALYLANCARCHGEDGQGGIGPPLNDQAKLYNAVTPDRQLGHRPPQPQLHLERPDGGRPLRLRRPQQRHARLARAQRPAQLPRGRGAHRLAHGEPRRRLRVRPAAHGEGGAEATAAPVAVAGWRDPDWQPAPGATPPAGLLAQPERRHRRLGTSGSRGGAGRARGIRSTHRGRHRRRTAHRRSSPPPPTCASRTRPGTPWLSSTSPRARRSSSRSTTPPASSTTSASARPRSWRSPTARRTWASPPGPQASRRSPGRPAADGLQFACTVPGHYVTMNGAVVVQG